MGVYLKQLLAGRDFGVTDGFAAQMANFVYLIGDDETRQCMIVDPAWDIQGLLDYIDREEMRLAGALVTHYHPDHIGGSIFGHNISGLAELMEKRPVKIHANEQEREGVMVVSGLSGSDIEGHAGGDEVGVGGVAIKLLHTPGHTPGSQCFLAGSRLVSGDTLFIGGCGRVDLPGGDAEQMYYSLTRVLGRLPGETRLYPGHNYSDKPVSTIAEEKRENYYLRIASLEDWMRLMSRPSF
jgi:glyoxylase-like metal-dependent hydrolase (beta-lactamase superfamily II)